MTDADLDALMPEPVAMAISYDGKGPYSLWEYGDGPSLDLEVRRQGGTTCKMPMYTRDQMREAMRRAYEAGKHEHQQKDQQ